MTHSLIELEMKDAHKNKRENVLFQKKIYTIENSEKNYMILYQFNTMSIFQKLE